MEEINKRVFNEEKQNCVSFTYRIDTNGKTSSLYFLFENVKLFLKDVEYVYYNYDINFPKEIINYLYTIVKSKEEGEDEEEDDEEEVDYTNIMRHVILENTLDNNSQCLSIDKFVEKTKEVASTDNGEKYSIPIPNWIWDIINNAPENNEENDEEEEKEIEDKLKEYDIDMYLKIALAKLYQNSEETLIEKIDNNLKRKKAKIEEDVEPKMKMADVVQDMTQLNTKLGKKIPDVNPGDVALPIDPNYPNDEDLVNRNTLNKQLEAMENQIKRMNNNTNESENVDDSDVDPKNLEQVKKNQLPDSDDESEYSYDFEDDSESELENESKNGDDGDVDDEDKCKEIIDELKKQREENELLQDNIKRIIERTNAAGKFRVKLRF